LTLNSSLVKFLQKHGDQADVLSLNLSPSTPNEIFRTCLVNTPSLKQLTIGSDFQTQAFQPHPCLPDVTLPLNSENDVIFTDFHLHLLTIVAIQRDGPSGDRDGPLQTIREAGV
jgi:hypothetical protein